ncbi:hypothetical protein EH223_08540 [candidate division KSB1 bacterium]|nr:MAG: hypothetical protein EH223_08540 [candidate division KSB1 bacterium]
MKIKNIYRYLQTMKGKLPMIVLTSDIEISTDESGEYGLKPGVFYRVIGAQSRTVTRVVDNERAPGGKESKKVDEEKFIVINERGGMSTVYPSKCKIRVAGEKNG